MTTLDRPPPQAVIEAMDPRMAAIMRAKTGAERLRIANAMFASARRMILNHLRAEHPDWDERLLQEAVAGRLSHRTP
jgi:hypothetical protein